MTGPETTRTHFHLGKGQGSLGQAVAVGVVRLDGEGKWVGLGKERETTPVSGFLLSFPPRGGPTSKRPMPSSFSPTRSKAMRGGLRAFAEEVWQTCLAVAVADLWVRLTKYVPINFKMIK